MELREIASYFNKIDVQRDPEALCSPQVSEAYTLYNSALDKLAALKNSEARTDLRKATQLKPDFDDAHILLGLCIFTLGNRIDAMRTFNQIKDPEKHTMAMNYFDKLSEKSKNVVTGYKSQQKYQETVRTVAPSTEKKSESEFNFSPFDDEKTEMPERRPQERPRERVVAEKKPVREKVVTEKVVTEKVVTDPKPQKPSHPSGESFFFEFFDEFAEEEKEIKQQENSASEAVSDVTPVRKTAVSSNSEKKPSSSQSRLQKTQNSQKPQSSQKPRSDTVQQKNTASRPTRNSEIQLSKAVVRAMIIMICVTVLISAALIIFFINGEKILNNGGQTKNPSDSGVSVATGSPTDDENSALPSEKPTEKPTSEPTQAPVGVLISEANKKLSEAEALATKKDYLGCYKLINEYNWTHLPTEKFSTLESLKENSFNKFCNEYYNGLKSNVEKDWEKVIEYGTALIEYCPDYDRGGDETGYVFFHLGKAYDKTGDKVNAEKYYKLTIETYPESRCKEWATYLLGQLNK